MSEPLTYTSLLSAVTGLAALQFLVSLWLAEKFKASLQRENGQFLESLRWEMRVREQAAKVAEYMALAGDLNDSSSSDEYRRANQLAWELALWLPKNVYKSLSQALTNPDEKINPLTVVVEVRRLLLEGKFGTLTQDDVLIHALGIGRVRNIGKL
jgi:hypothetical protein